ncbi:hypothetical protein GN956_G7960 [Arapaima gigas]
MTATQKHGLQHRQARGAGQTLPAESEQSCGGPVMKQSDKNGKSKGNEQADRRPSYPGEQWVKQANTSTKTWVKVAMAIVYFLSVSVAACMLVIYYVIFWSPNATNNTDSSLTDNASCSP